jgi:hypothetical protein
MEINETSSKHEATFLSKSASLVRLQLFSICLLAEGQVYINSCINSITIYICLINSIYTVEMLLLICCSVVTMFLLWLVF